MRTTRSPARCAATANSSAAKPACETRRHAGRRRYTYSSQPDPNSPKRFGPRENALRTEPHRLHAFVDLRRQRRLVRVPAEPVVDVVVEVHATRRAIVVDEIAEAAAPGKTARRSVSADVDSSAPFSARTARRWCTSASRSSRTDPSWSIDRGRRRTARSAPPWTRPCAPLPTCRPCGAARPTSRRCRKSRDAPDRGRIRLLFSACHGISTWRFVRTAFVVSTLTGSMSTARIRPTPSSAAASACRPEPQPMSMNERPGKSSRGMSFSRPFFNSAMAASSISAAYDAQFSPKAKWLLASLRSSFGTQLPSGWPDAPDDRTPT